MKKLLTILLVLFLTNFTPSVAEETSVLGEAISASYEQIDIGGTPQIKQTIDVKLINGDHKGQILKTDNILGGNPYYDINVSPKDKLVLHSSDGEYFISDHYRLNVLIVSVLIFASLVIFVGRKKGVNSLIAILITIGLIYFVLRPMILFGISPLFGALAVSLLATIATMYMVGGVNKKSSSAVLGTIGSLIVASIMALVVIKLAKLTGFSDETTLYLYSSHPELNFISITASIIVLAALGAVMDIAMSIASTINEIYKNNTELSVQELFEAGMNVGRDIIGTMANTLILVYMGGALPLLLLSGEIDAFKFFNLNTVVTEITSALIGSIALLICVPITAYITANLIKFTDEKVKKHDIIS